MARRRVTRTEKDDRGSITALCGDWGKVSTPLAIKQINDGLHTYYVEEVPRKSVEVIPSANGRYLRTEPDGRPENNLDNLLDC